MPLPLNITDLIHDTVIKSERTEGNSFRNI